MLEAKVGGWQRWPQGSPGGMRAWESGMPGWHKQPGGKLGNLGPCIGLRTFRASSVHIHNHLRNTNYSCQREGGECSAHAVTVSKRRRCAEFKGRTESLRRRDICSRLSAVETHKVNVLWYEDSQQCLCDISSSGHCLNHSQLT